MCDSAFSVLAPHQCQPTAKRRVYPVPSPGSALDADFGALEASFATLTRLCGHSDMVTRCAWHPRAPTLVTASADATARLWELDGSGGGAAKGEQDEEEDGAAAGPNAAPANFFRTLTGAKVVLRQKVDPAAHNRSVTALEWSGAGDQLATGVFDGRAFVWNATGELRRTLARHSAAVSCVRWSPDGARLATGSVDRRVMLWDASSGAHLRTFAQHAGPVLDVDWRSASAFASCATDGVVLVCDAGSDEPAARLAEHRREVNSVRWRPAKASGRQLLASASDDGTVKLWNADAKGGARRVAADLTDHEREVTTVRWAPGGAALASASLDTTVRLWDAASGSATAVLSRHMHPVTSLAYSPDGGLLASAAHDRVHVWDVREGRLARTYRSEGSVNDLSWDSSGRSLALSLTDATCVVWRCDSDGK